MGKEQQDICILGAGSFGTALAWLLGQKHKRITLWTRREEQAKRFRETRQNAGKLPGVILPENVRITSDAAESVRDKDVIVWALPSISMRHTAQMVRPYLNHEKPLFVSCTKGIEADSYLLMSEVLQAEFPYARVAALSGPSHAEEVGKGLPTAIVAGAEDEETACIVQDLFMTDFFRVYTSTDIRGIETGGALKNVIALAAGIADGMGYGDNSKAAMITRGVYEMTRLGVAMGGRPETFSGLSGIGDLIVTCASMHSRNRRAGILIGQGKSCEEACDEVQMVVEGVHSAKAALQLSKKHGIEMPIVEAVNRVLFEGFDSRDAVEELMLRDRKAEHSTSV